MSKYLTGGVVAGLFACAGAASVAFGKPALGAFLSDPDTAATFTVVVTGAVGLVAGVLKGVRSPA